MQNHHTPTWEYHIIAERYQHPDLGLYRSYGIHAFEIVDKHVYPVAVVHDITTVRTQAETLAQFCNKHQLSPVHLHDVVNDFIAKTS